MSFLTSRSTFRCATSFLTARNMVSSPAMVPTTSGHASRSSATATRFASPGGVFFFFFFFFLFFYIIPSFYLFFIYFIFYFILFLFLSFSLFFSLFLFHFYFSLSSFFLYTSFYAEPLFYLLQYSERNPYLFVTATFLAFSSLLFPTLFSILSYILTFS